MARTLKLALVAALVTATQVIGVPAFAKCQPSGRPVDSTHHWTGSRNFPNTTVIAVRSQIYNYSPWVQPGYDSVGYVMLRTADGTKYGQDGWEEYSGGSRYTFAEWDNGYGWTKQERSPDATGTYSYYEVDWTGGTNPWFLFVIDGSQWFGQPLSPAWTPNAAEIMGEVQSSASQMPGGYSTHEQFLNRNINFGAGWQSFGGDDYNSDSSAHPNWYATNWVDAWTDKVWDQACP